MIRLPQAAALPMRPEMRETLRSGLFSLRTSATNTSRSPAVISPAWMRSTPISTTTATPAAKTSSTQRESDAWSFVPFRPLRKDVRF